MEQFPHEQRTHIPGVYIQDFRTHVPPPPHHELGFSSDVSQMPSEEIAAEITRLQISLKHLRRSNVELQEDEQFSEDEELQVAVQENEAVIQRQETQVVLLRRQLEKISATGGAESNIDAMEMDMNERQQQEQQQQQQKDEEDESVYL